MNNPPKSVSKRKSVLGRGLSTLIPTISEDGEQGDGAGAGEVQLVDINAIDPNPHQPRVDFDDEEIAGLAASIQNQGLLQPVVLRKKGDRYEIISGERRFRAHRHLMMDSIPCIVKTKVSDREMLELALVENIQREELNELEKAAAYQKLIAEFSYTHEELAAQVGKSRAVITNTLRLLNLPDEVQQMVRKSEISTGHARAILTLPTAEKQLEAAHQVLSDKLTVREIEQITQAEKPKKPPKKPVEQLQDPNIAHQLERMQYRFGTSVKLKITGNNKGRVEIEYFSEDDLVRIFDLLLDETVLDDVSLS
ncbi:MAG: ParB/RepB/Spo0J family partition protein [Chitinispirillia bacterium]|nr:ParB/RepB/Spo0J family partition protein [Chitinispirillia bacterium]MCL2241886.1 ParB/RepB/Spo0J family partition protein [Chitinispirillia bacterium]